MKTGLRYTIYASLFLIPFIPLYVANSLFFPFITGKGFAFRILVEIAFFAWLLLAFADKKYRPTFSWVFVAYSAFVAWMFIADLFAVNAHKAIWSNFERMDGWITMIHVFLFFVVTGAVLSADKLWRNWWMTFLGASALVSLYCLLQLSGNLEIHQGGGCPRRKKLFPEYKANRIKVKSDFKAVHLTPGEKPTKKWIMDDTENKLRQVKTLVDALKHLPVCQLYVAETECDDVIGFLIRNKLKSENAMKIIVSSDRDFYQLLDEPNVKLYNPADKSFHDGPIVKVKVGKDEYVEIPARNYALVRTLTGDDSDNIPGVPGLGFKTALKDSGVLSSTS
jgi:hypothetical protein